jgi:outer membrane protein assembly factor BamB
MVFFRTSAALVMALSGAKAQPPGFPSGPQPWSAYRYDSQLGRRGYCPWNIPVLDASREVTVNWKFQANGAIHSSACHDGDNRLFVGSDDYSVYGVDESTGAKLWEYETKGEVHSSCQLEAGLDWDGIPTVYIGSDDGAMYALHASSGEEKLTPYQTGAPLRASTAVRMHVALNGTTAFIGDEEGTIHGWNARDGSERYRVPSLSASNAAPLTPTYAYCGIVFAFRDGTLRNLSPHHFPGYEPDDRDESCAGRPPIQWEFDTGRPIVAEPMTLKSVGGGLPSGIATVTADGHVFAITLASFSGVGGGDQRFTTFVGGGDGEFFRAPMSMSADYTTLFICSSLGVVTALDNMTGELMWKVALPGASCMHGGAAIDGNKQIFMPTSQGIFVLSPSNGDILWQFPTSSAVTNSPSITEAGDLIFGTEAGELFSITVQ